MANSGRIRQVMEILKRFSVKIPYNIFKHGRVYIWIFYNAYIAKDLHIFDERYAFYIFFLKQNSGGYLVVHCQYRWTIIIIRNQILG